MSTVLKKIGKPGLVAHRKVLVFGSSGTGKTHFLGTSEAEERVKPFLVLSFESSVSTLVGCDIDVLPIETWQDYNDIYEYLASDANKYKGIGIDSLSETHIYSLMGIVDAQSKDTKRPLRDVSIEQGDYGKSLIQMRRFIRAFRTLPAHIFFTAGVRQDTVPNEGWVRFPNLSGTLSEEVVGMFDVTGYMAQTAPSDGKASQRLMVLQNYPGIRAKVQTTWGKQFPNELYNPSITQLFDLLEVK